MNFCIEADAIFSDKIIQKRLQFTAEPVGYKTFRADDMTRTKENQPVALLKTYSHRRRKDYQE